MSSTTLEYYIRQAHESDARGPFTLEQLSSLAENGQVTPDTFYYDAAAETWTLVSADTTLMGTLFPEKKSLKVKPKSAAQVTTLNTVKESDRAITVNDMLLASEGRTEDTRHKADPAEAQARAANIGLYSALAVLIVLTAAFLLPSIDLLLALDFLGLLLAGFPIIGLITLGLAVCLGLGAVVTYPTVRFAAMLALGFTGAIFYFNGQPIQLGLAAAAGVGLYFCTICLSMPGVLLSAVLGLGGAVGLAHHYFTT